jgi:hypothetical protein
VIRSVGLKNLGVLVIDFRAGPEITNTTRPTTLTPMTDPDESAAAAILIRADGRPWNTTEHSEGFHMSDFGSPRSRLY